MKQSNQVNTKRKSEVTVSGVCTAKDISSANVYTIPYVISSNTSGNNFFANTAILKVFCFSLIQYPVKESTVRP